MRTIIPVIFMLICLIILFTTSSPSLASPVEVTVKQLTADQILVNILYTPTDQEVVSVVAYFTKELRVGYLLTQLSDGSFSLEVTLFTNQTSELTLAIELSNGALVYELYGPLPLPTDEEVDLATNHDSPSSVINALPLVIIPLVCLGLIVILWTYERSRQFPRGE